MAACEAGKGEQMKNKILQMPKIAVFFTAIVIAAAFLGIMNLTGVLLFGTLELKGYGNSMVSEFAGGVLALLFLLAFGYQGVLTERGKGWIHGLYIGGFLTGYCGIQLVAQLYVQMMSQDTSVVSPVEIFFFAATMFLIGWTEELIFRGVILNLFLERFQKTQGGILSAILLSGVLFGAVHLTNVFQGVTLISAAVQALEGALLGIILGAVYVRTGNIWLVIAYHATVDFAGLMGSGIFGAGSTVEQINQMSAVNLIAVPILLIPCIVLLRPKKLRELEQEANHMVVFETYEEADSDAVFSLTLGIISIMTGFLGYGLGIGIAGAAGGAVSRRIKPQQNGMARVGIILSRIGIVVSLAAAVVLCFFYSNLGGI